MPPDAVTTTEATSLLDRLPPDVVGYAVLGLIVWWITRAAYRDTSQARDDLLDRLESRLDQTERSLAAVTHDLAQSRRTEHECRARMDALEKKYELRIAELEHEVSQLRGEISEPMI